MGGEGIGKCIKGGTVGPYAGRSRNDKEMGSRILLGRNKQKTLNTKLTVSTFFWYGCSWGTCEEWWFAKWFYDIHIWERGTPALMISSSNRRRRGLKKQDCVTKDLFIYEQKGSESVQDVKPFKTSIKEKGIWIPWKCPAPGRCPGTASVQSVIIIIQHWDCVQTNLPCK